jgi:agmatinase
VAVKRSSSRPARRTRQAFDPDAAAGPGSGLFGLDTPNEAARVVVIPVPFDATCSYRAGAARAPEAVVVASHQVDLFDREYGPIHEAGIAMLEVPRDIAALSRAARRAATPVLKAGGAQPGNRRHAGIVRQLDEAGSLVNAWVGGMARKGLERGQIVGVLGGDHSAPFGLIDVLAERRSGLGILHVDAHCDLRDAYEGFRWSHASIFHNVMKECRGVSRLVQVGIRDFGRSESRQVERSRGRIVTFFESDVRTGLLRGDTWDLACRRMIEPLPERVHVSFDIDGLSPDLCPHTGTPVPGGLSFAEACHLLRTLSESGREVVGFDLCEVAPGPKGDEWDANVGARLLYKMIGCALASQRR